FMDFGLKKLISTSYAPESNHGGMFYEPTLFETESPIYDADRSRLQSRVFTLVPEDFSGDGKIDLDDLQWEYLEGDGDFQSLEVTALRDEADMVVTNPPFSLFRNFVAWLVEGEVRFSVIGNMNASTYKEVFPLVSDNQIWKGATANNTDMVFQVPEGTEIRSSDREKAERMGYVGNFTRLGNSCWFTNIEHGRRHEPLQLMTMEDNLKYNKKIAEAGYPKYDNYDAIEVGWVNAIPSDYDGVMGVPITFLDKYNPDQFEIVANMDDHDDMKRIGVTPLSEDFIAGYRAAGGTGAQRAGGYWVGLRDPHRFPFKRIFISRRR
ncbi:MAG: adenine-specific methyltransferase EcoRI family protein, partial [Planctomycetaceae bacterium]